MTKKEKKQSTWSDIKAKLTDFDRAGLLALIQDLYAASKDNQTFLHARFSLSDDGHRRNVVISCNLISTLL